MNFINKPLALSLSGNLEKFVIGTEASLQFTLKQEEEVILSGSYDPGNTGMVTIDVRDIIEARLSFILKDSSQSYVQDKLAATFTAVFNNTEEYSFRVIRSGVDKLADTAGNFLTANFLTWQPQIKKVTYYSPEFITYYAVINSKAVITAHFGNNIEQKLLLDLEADNVYTFPMQYATIAKLFDGRFPDFYDLHIGNTVGERLTYVQRYIPSTFMSEDEQWFLFENSLGGLDTFRAYGSTDFEAEHEHNIAELDEVSIEYRVDTERKFSKNTGFLDGYQRRWLLDFFPSKSKYIYTANSLRAIVVTESNVNYSSKDLPSNYDFTYKYADAKPLLNLPRTEQLPDDLDITVPELGSFTLPPRLVDFPRLPLSEGALFPVQNPFSERWTVTTAESLALYVRDYLGTHGEGSGGVGHTHGNFDLLQVLSYEDGYLRVDNRKLYAGRADVLRTVDYVEGKSGAKIEKGGTAELQELLVRALATIYELDVTGLATLFHAVIKDYISSETFIPGMEGSGMKLYKALGGDWNLEVDNVTVRKSMNIFELILSKIRAVNGGLVISVANGKVKYVDETESSYRLGIEGDMTFVAGDLVRCQVFSSNNLKYYWAPVLSVDGDAIVLDKTFFLDGNVPNVGDELVQMGNLSDTSRQGLIFLSAQDGKPRISILDGVDSPTFTDKMKVITGDLNDIHDSDFPAEYQPSGYGLYAINAFLKGIFLLSTGENVETKFSVLENLIKSEISSIRNELLKKDNFLFNSSFASDTEGWSTTNDIRFFTVNGKLLYFNKNFYSEKRNMVAIVLFDNKSMLRIKNSGIIQLNASLAQKPIYTDEDRDEIGNMKLKTFYASFRCHVITPGTLIIGFRGQELYSEVSLSPTDGFIDLEYSGTWDGTGDFVLKYTGDIYIYSLALTNNALEDIIYKFNSKLEQTDSRIEAMVKRQDLAEKTITELGILIDGINEDLTLFARKQYVTDENAKLWNSLNSEIEIRAEGIRLLNEKTSLINNEILQLGIDIGNIDNSLSLYVKSDKIISAINLSKEGIKVQGNKIDMEGLVTFSSFSSDLKNTYNNDIGNATIKAKNDMAKALTGTASYDSLISAIGGKTVIAGGFINTNMLKTDTLIADSIMTYGLNVNNNFIVNKDGSVDLTGIFSSNKDGSRVIIDPNNRHLRIVDEKNRTLCILGSISQSGSYEGYFRSYIYEDEYTTIPKKSREYTATGINEHIY